MAVLRIRPNTTARVLLGVTAILLTLGVLWLLLALGPGGPSAADVHQVVAASNQFALPSGLISQTRFLPTHPGAVDPTLPLDGDSSDNLPVLALSSIAFLLLATLPLLSRRRLRHLGNPGPSERGSLVAQSLPVASSVGS